MDRDEALRLLKGGKEGVGEWNRRRKAGEAIPDLNRADLKGANLRGASFREAELGGANLSGANLSQAFFGGANLNQANLRRADLRGANLRDAILRAADLNRANLAGANLAGAYLGGARLSGTVLRDANFVDATCGLMDLVTVDLSTVSGLETVLHLGPSGVGVDTLFKSAGNIPEKFLRGCGLSPWEIEVARLYEPCLTAADISDLLMTRLFTARTKGPLYIGGVFISCSHTDAKFVDKVDRSLYDEGASVWLDRHDAVAGPLKEQIGQAIRLNDVVLLVLSEASVESDWVENALEMARKREKDENRDVLCPVALDESWKAKVEGDPLWRQLAKKVILDFSGWRTKKFGPQFEKLVKGLKIYYDPKRDQCDE